MYVAGSIPGLYPAVAFFLRLSILLVKSLGEEYEVKYPLRRRVAAGEGSATILGSLVQRVSGPRDILL